MRQTGTAKTTGLVAADGPLPELVGRSRAILTFAEAGGTGVASIYEGDSADPDKLLVAIEAPCKISFDTPVRVRDGIFVTGTATAQVVLHLG